MSNGQRSKQKGSSFERDTCRKLSLWLSQGERDDLLWRSAMSGGRATVGLADGVTRRAQAGDLSSIDAMSHSFIDTHVVECKHYRMIEADTLVFTNKGELAKFWDRAQEDAMEHGKRPWLIAKQNHRPTLLCMHRQEFMLTWLGAVTNTFQPLIEVPQLNMTVVNFQLFLDETQWVMNRIVF